MTHNHDAGPRYELGLCERQCDTPHCMELDSGADPRVFSHEYILIIPSFHLFFLAFLLFFLFASSLGLKQAGGKHGCVSLFHCSPRSPVLQSDTGDSINIFARLCPFHPMHAVSSVHTISMYDTPSPQYTITIYRRILLDI